jgi:hypothetical protein
MNRIFLRPGKSLAGEKAGYGKSKDEYFESCDVYLSVGREFRKTAAGIISIQYLKSDEK